ncbi:ATPase 9, plasma membrane-type-like isoform X3 [Miscanthus floridulus]|uniref:ATPase 9, plasma membrane-type-like isoform X3 n=1 Tax=Miscanthus floridulus TaxID=154761 RepID=UPI003459752C
MASSDDMAMADLETGEEEEVLRRLGTAEEAGLTDNEAARRLRLHGPNVVVLSHHEGSMLQRFLTALFSLWGWDHVFPKYNNMVRIILNSMSWVTVLTTMVSLAITSAGQRSCEMAIVIFIVATSLIACFIAKLVLEYAKAPLETKAHAPRAKVLRDGRWRDVHAANLVPGDIIFLKVGDIVPANARVLRFQKIDTMTCWAKRSVDCAHGFLIYYAWTVSCGQGTAVVIATGRGIPGSTLRLYPQRYARPGQLKEGVMLAGCFCASLVLVGTIAEIVLSFLFQKQNCSGIPLNAHFMPLIGGIPMAMPTFLYLALALGSVRLCFLGIASRGTVALEDLASVDVILFNMTGTLTCNQPCFVRDKIEMFADGVNKDRAIILAARASRSQQELYIEPIDAAILRLLDDPEQARFGVEVLEHHACFFVALKLMFQTTYIDESNGSKCCVFKGDPAKVDSCWEFIALLPYTDDLRSDSADAIDSLIDLGLDIRVLTESTLSTTKQVCGKLGKLGTNVVPAHSVFELARNNREVHSNINGISDLFPEDKSDIVRRLRNFGCHCAMVGYEFLDHDAIGESHIGISVADATDYTKSESDLVLTRPALIPVFSAVQISRKICQMMRSYTIFTISSTVHLFGIRVIFHLWNFDLSSILAFMITACNYCTSFAMLFERVELNKSPDKWRVQKIITSGAAFGSYIVLTTAIFYRVARTANPFACKLKHISLMGSDEEIRAALFLQMSTVNQAIALFVHSDGCCIIRCPGPFVTFAFVVSQMVATQKVVHGDLNFALTKGIGCVRAGLIWLYNLVLLLTLVLACRKWRRTKMTSEKLLTICMRSAFLRIVLIWFLYVILDVRVH